MSGQFIERPAYQCQKCKAVFLTDTGMMKHSEKCRYAEPEMEGQISFEGSEQYSSDALRST